MNNATPLPVIKALQPGEITQSDMTTTELYSQISVARQFPRDMTAFRKMVIGDVLCNPETAQRCAYKLSKGGTEIVGPSVRFAEALARAYGNLRVISEIVEDTGKFIKARAKAWDLENNLAIMRDVQRRITNKHGQRYSDDMIQTTAMAACSIAFRNVVLNIVPESFWRPLFEESERMAVEGYKQEFDQHRLMAINWFLSFQGITEAMVLRLAGVDHRNKLRPEHLHNLRLHATAIKDGDRTIYDVMNIPEHKRPEATTADNSPEPPPAARTPEPPADPHPDTDQSPEKPKATPSKPAAKSKAKDAPAKQVTNSPESMLTEALTNIASGEITEEAYRSIVESYGEIGDEYVHYLTESIEDAVNPGDLVTVQNSVNDARTLKKIAPQLHGLLSNRITARKESM